MKKCLMICIAVAVGISGYSAPQGTRYLSYDEARQIVAALEEVAPADLKGKSPEVQAKIWPQWLAGCNAQIRARLLKGDEDTLVNFLFFGASYTKQPRLSAVDFRTPGDQTQTDLNPSLPMFPLRTRQTLEARIADLTRALAAPGTSERLLFFRSLVIQKGFQPADTVKIKAYFENNVTRVLKEAAVYAAALESARKTGDASAEFAERSTLFHERGLSLDTSLPPDFALEQSLAELKQKKLLGPGSIRRVAVIGPGLDFIDKDSGYDFYAPQTIQPFAMMDSLLRLGLAHPDGVDVTTLDVSPRILEHLNRARLRSGRGPSYTIQLPRTLTVGWNSDYIRFWENFGNQIGGPASAALAPAADLALRAVAIRPAIVLRVHPVDLNIVAQQMVLPAGEEFDLIVATNIFVYYDVFLQSLALCNVGSMLRPGGFLLSNNALLELPSAQIHSVGYKSVAYSDRPSDGDTIVWYQKQGK